jgi:hypothetical protein
MAVTINASTSAGLVQTADTSGVLALQTAGTTAVTVDASQNVGIGTASPAANLHVSSSGNTEVLSATTGANYTTFRLKNSTNDYSMQIRTDVSNAWVLRDETAGANRLVVDTSGNVEMAGTLTTAAQSIAKASLPTGSVLQVVSFGTDSAVSNSTSTPVDTGVFATITPISATSKILVLVTLMGVYKSAANSSTRVHLFLYRGTNSGTLINNSGANFYTQSLVDQRGAIALSVLDSPSTTSAQIYTLYFSNDEGVAVVSVNRDGNSGTSTMTLMEIAA